MLKQAVRQRANFVRRGVRVPAFRGDDAFSAGR